MMKTLKKMMATLVLLTALQLTINQGVNPGDGLVSPDEEVWPKSISMD